MSYEEMSQAEGEENRAYQGPTYGIKVLGPERQELPALTCPTCRDHAVYVTEEVPTVIVQNPLGVRAALSVYHYDRPVNLDGETQRVLEAGEIFEISPVDLGPSDGEVPFAGTVTVVIQPVESEEFSAIQTQAGNALAELYRALGHETPQERADQSVREVVTSGPLQYGFGYQSKVAYEFEIEYASSLGVEGDAEFWMGVSITTISIGLGELPPRPSERRSFWDRLLRN